MLKLKVITQNSQRVCVIVLMLLSVIAINFVKTTPSNANPATEIIVDENESIKLNIGSTYRANFSASYPSGALNNPNTTVVAGNSEAFLCRAPQSIPYGTKLRLFTTAGDKIHQKLCVVSGFNSSSIITQESVLEIDVIFTDKAEANAWESQNGQINLLEIGDGKNLNFGDPGTYMTADTSAGQSDGLNDVSDPKSREMFYNKNNILFYNPDMCMLSTPAEDVLPEDADLEKRAEYVIRFLTSIGFTLNQAAGMASNFDGESGITPTCMEKCQNSSGVKQSHYECCHNNKKDPITGKYKYDLEGPVQGFGFGITQVTGAPRQEIIFRVAKERNQHIFDIDVQLEAMLVDMAIDRPYSAWPERMLGSKCGYRLANKVPNVCINQAKTVKEAAFAMIDNFEAPGMAINCGYLAYLNKSSAECSMKKKDFKYSGPATQETAERTYQHYIETRVKKGEAWAEKWRGIIQDGGGVTREGLIALLNSGALRNRTTSTQNFELEGADLDLCDTANNKRGDLIKLVKETTWPLFCKKGTTREENGQKCSAVKPMDYYLKLTECRKYRSDAGPCKVPGGYVGAALGQDCGGFVTTLMQESGADSEYNHHKGFKTYVDGQYDYLESSPKWRKIFSYNDENFDSSLLMPGDVAICSEKKDGCPSSGHTFMYIGEIEGFQYQAASASYFERYPMAGSEIKSASRYNWYRNKEIEASSDNVSGEDDLFDPRQRSGDGKLSEGEYTFVQNKSLSEMQEIAQTFRNHKLSQDGRGQPFCNGNQIDAIKAQTGKEADRSWPNQFGCNPNSGRCLQFAYYHADKINRGMVGLGSPESVGSGGGMKEDQVLDKDKRVVLSRLYDHLNSGKTAVLLVNGSSNNADDFARRGSRHFVTVVGYKSSVKSASELKETDLAIIDSFDAKLKAMDAPNNRFMIFDRNPDEDGARYTQWRVDLRK